jgi:hypothetical protein
MTRKYNARHPERSRSRYKQRLEKRGYSKSPMMESLQTLRNRQGERVSPAETLLRSIFEESE